jgi:TolB protein
MYFRQRGFLLRRIAVCLLATAVAGIPGVAARAKQAEVIAFASNAEGAPRIHVIRADGSGRRKVTGLAHQDSMSERLAPGEGDAQPSWSPDGTSIVFVRGIWNLDAGYGATPGGQKSRLVVVDLFSGRLRTLGTVGLFPHRPVWSPDGSRILYSSQAAGTRTLPPSVFDLFSLDLRTGENKRITQTTQWGLPGPLTNYGAWSPDGFRVVFNNSTPGGASDLWVVHANGGRPRQITFSGRAYAPSWTPGVDIAFTITGREGDAPVRHVWTIDPDTMATRQVTRGVTEDRFPSWSSDGTVIAFSRGASATAVRHRLARVNSAGTGFRHLTEGTNSPASGDSMPSFSLP